jgi:hypothetical protein
MRNTAQFLIPVSLFVVTFCLGGCRKEPEPSAVTKSEGAPQATSATPPSSAVPPAAVPDEAPAVVASAEPLGRDLGAWIESASYKFKVRSIKRCADGAASDKSYRLGINVQVFAKYDEFVVRERDVTLESGGIILNSEINLKPSPGCTPLLENKQLRHDQTLGGVVVFTIPPEFDAKKAEVAYRPTRWGGAPRVAFKVPDCFDACGAK